MILPRLIRSSKGQLSLIAVAGTIALSWFGKLDGVETAAILSVAIIGYSGATAFEDRKGKRKAVEREPPERSD